MRASKTKFNKKKLFENYVAYLIKESDKRVLNERELLTLIAYTEDIGGLNQGIHWLGLNYGRPISSIAQRWFGKGTGLLQPGDIKSATYTPSATSNNTRKKGVLNGQVDDRTKTQDVTYKEFENHPYWNDAHYKDDTKIYTQGLMDPGVDFEPEYSGSFTPIYDDENCYWEQSSSMRPWTDKGLIYPEHLYVNCELPNSQESLSHQMITGVPLVRVPNNVLKLNVNFDINNDTGDLAYLVMSKSPIESGAIEELSSISDSQAQVFYNMSAKGKNIRTFTNIVALELETGSESYSVEIDNPDRGLLYYKILWPKDNERAVYLLSKPNVTVSNS